MKVKNFSLPIGLVATSRKRQQKRRNRKSMINDWRKLTVCSRSRARERKNVNYHSIEAMAAASVSFVTQTTLFSCAWFRSVAIKWQMINFFIFHYCRLILRHTTNVCLSYMEINTSEMRGCGRLIYNTKSSNVSSILSSQKHFSKLFHLHIYNRVEAIVITLDHKLSFLFAYLAGRRFRQREREKKNFYRFSAKRFKIKSKY